MRKFLLSIFVFSALLATIFSNFVFAKRISDERAGLISMTCGSIKIQLKKLQKNDSRVRVDLGSKTEQILNGYIANLNLRLIRNNLTTDNLSSLQTTFNSERQRFKSDFTNYARSLEELISIDCQNDPYGFYQKLDETRAKRAELRSSYLRLLDILEWHRSAVLSLKDSL